MASCPSFLQCTTFCHPSLTPPSVKEEGSKRLRSGTVIQKNGTNGTTGNGANPKPVDFPEPHPLLSSSQFSTRSPVNRLSMSVSGGRPPSVLGYSVDELDNDTIEKLLAARTAADKAELKARNELHHALVALEDRRSQRSEAEADVEAKDEEIADLQKRLEKARSERDELADKLAHVSNHVTAAENTYSECSRKVIAATAASKNAQRDYSLAVRGE